MNPRLRANLYRSARMKRHAASDPGAHVYPLVLATVLILLAVAGVAGGGT